MTWPLSFSFRRLAALAVLVVSISADLPAQDWRTASREPAGLAPDPATTPEAVCSVCDAPKGGHAVGELCNNNCGGRVVLAPAPTDTTCPRCEGRRYVSGLGDPCDRCSGSGRVPTKEKNDA